ncbi:SDR family oxidoreductase [Shewanella aestuarii]|uniref:SDR family oxidoreductase n=1 Tax=Shewanella aestuarii TaxID=1028752 RepID=A0A6G9QIA9_9GAMM|nr:SDR family oxidoreductase [Shewanella aestuarii]QIR14236.1 SDR family oxidoreductase [Shewanella aestuarii]
MFSVSIIGCGWFGLPFAKSLIRQGIQVKSNKRNVASLEQLTQVGIKAYPLDLAAKVDTDLVQGLFDSDVLVVNIPPGLRRGETDYLSNLATLKKLIGTRQYQKLIFISTTGVYPNNDMIQFESDAAPYNDSSKILLEAESMFADYSNACIIRFAGLIGPQRHPGRFFAGKTDISGANVAVNLVHLEDCINAVTCVIKAEKIAPYYNLCAPIHPTRGEFYPQAAQHLGLQAPQFNQQVLPSKIINGDLICQQLGFVYQHSDPIEMLDAC